MPTNDQVRAGDQPLLPRNPPQFHASPRNSLPLKKPRFHRHNLSLAVAPNSRLASAHSPIGASFGVVGTSPNVLHHTLARGTLSEVPFNGCEWRLTMRVALTDRFCASAKSATVQTDYFDAQVTGLALRVTSGGTRTWTLLHGMPRRRVTLGRYPSSSLHRQLKSDRQSLTSMIGDIAASEAG